MIDLVNRRAFFDSYADTQASLPPSLTKYGIRFTCPCCGYPTLGARGGYQICYLCWWEDDGQDDHNAEEILGGPNADFSLERARRNFAIFPVMFEPENDRRISGGDSPAELATKQSVIVAFDSMALQQDVDHETLWAKVIAGEHQLHRLLKQSIR